MSNWEKVKLSTLCSRIGDGLHGTPNYTDKGDIYFINGNNIKGGNIILDSETKKVNQKDFDKNFIELNKNSLLLSINGTLGNMAFFKGEKVMLGKSAAYLNFKTDINRFYFYYFQLSNIQKYFYDVATGSTIKNLSLKSLQDFEVPKPNKDEHTKIAKVLSDLDAKIELNNKINAELEAMAKTLYDYWFVQFDFPYVTSSGVEKPYKSSGGKMVWNEELKREIPEGWEVQTLNNLTSYISRGISPKYTDEGGICVLNQKCVRNRMIIYKESRRNDNSKRDATSKKIFIHDILVNSTGVGTLGRVAIVNHLPEDFITVDSHVTIVRADDFLINKLFFGFSLLEKQKEIEGLSNGSTGQVELSRYQLEGINMIVPPTDLQLKFENIYKKHLDRIAICAKENQELASLRDWLLPMLMNGQITVGDTNESIEEKKKKLKELTDKFIGYPDPEEELGMVTEDKVEYKKE